MYHKMEDSIHCTHHLFMEIGIIVLEWERKLEKVKKNSGKRITVRKKQPIQRNSDSGRHFLNKFFLNKFFVNKALSNFDLEGWRIEVFTVEMHYQKV